MVNIFIDDKRVSVPANFTVMQACASVSIDIPRFCYHERLSIAGSCRMCIVEVSNSKKLVAACAFPVVEGIRVYTNSLRVRRAREGVIEFLLANHPLDCPICDQGGECDLQDITVVFGSDRGRFYEVEKRAVEDKECGPFVKTVMTRCIHCTRCVRFLSELGSDSKMGVTGRGLAMEIGTYVSQHLNDELSGNIIDLCPVGALTSKPFAFTGRTWELVALESIDIMDSYGSHIRADVVFNKVMRVLPRQNVLNEEWITNLARFFYDGLLSQRLLEPMVRKSHLYRVKSCGMFVNNVSSELVAVSWDSSVSLLLSKMLTANDVQVLFGSFLDVETVVVATDTFRSIGVSNFVMENTASISVDFTLDYLLNVSLRDIERLITEVVLVGVLPRLENPLFNLKMRKSYLNYGTKYFSIGNVVYTSFPVITLGVSVLSLFKIIEGTHVYTRLMYSAQIFPFFLLGSSLLALKGSTGIVNAVKWLSVQIKQYADRSIKNVRELLEYNINVFFGMLQYNVSKLAVFDSGVALASLNMSKEVPVFYYMLKSDDTSMRSSDNQFICYQGSHGDKSALLADVLLPVLSGAEYAATYVNMEGIYQYSKQLVSGVDSVKNNIVLLNLLKSEFLQLNLFSYIKCYHLVSSQFLYKNWTVNVINRLNWFVNSRVVSVYSKDIINITGLFNFVSNVMLNVLSLTYYNQNSISRASRVLNNAAKLELSRMTILKI